MKNHRELNDELLNNFLNRTFFQSWKMTADERDRCGGFINYASLELELNPTCSLHCKYCYLSKYGKELMPKESWNNKKILKNLGYLLDWLKKEKLNPRLELFSGDPLVQNVGYDVLDMILDWYDNEAGTTLSVPTNMDFLHYEDKTQKVLDYYKKFAEKKINFYLSASVDGKFMEENRPHRSSLLKYDDAFYDKLFRFCKVTGTGFHPMVYSSGVERWKDNFLWFQDMFERYGIPWDNLYLLEVRNGEWTLDQCKELDKLIHFVGMWAWDKLGHDKDKMIEFIFDHHGYNILSNTLSSCGRGIGCSIQSTMMLRLGDLKFSPCHRTSYDFMNAGEFIIGGTSIGSKDGIIGISAINPSLFFAINAMNITMQPMCTSCAIRTFCQGGCLGSQYETTGDLFAPIPSVCRMFHWKLRATFNLFKEVGILPQVLKIINKDKAETHKYLVEENIL